MPGILEALALIKGGVSLIDYVTGLLKTANEEKRDLTPEELDSVRQARDLADTSFLDELNRRRANGG